MEDVEVVYSRGTIFVLGIMQKMHITFIQLAIFNSVVYVAGDDRLIFLNQLSHLSLRQPYCIILQTNINLCLSVLRLVDDNLVLF
jgi:hypothetical protein